MKLPDSNLKAAIWVIRNEKILLWDNQITDTAIKTKVFKSAGPRQKPGACHIYHIGKFILHDKNASRDLDKYLPETGSFNVYLLLFLHKTTTQGLKAARFLFANVQ